MAGWLAADAGKGTEGWKETFFAFFFFPNFEQQWQVRAKGVRPSCFCTSHS